MNHEMLRAGFYQFAPAFGDAEGNLSRVCAALKDIAADIVVLPELAFTGYAFHNRAELSTLAEDPVKSATVDGLISLSRDRDVVIVTGFAEKQADRLFNSALVIGPGGLLHIYRKLHLFDHETEYFDPGDTPLETIEIRGIRIGVMICFDWAFPEAARVLALKGVELICHPSNLVLAHCQEAMRTRCLENHVFAVTANRIGSENRSRGKLAFTGQSQLVAPDGSVIHRAAPDQETLFTAEIDPAAARNKWLTDRNDLIGDRRPAFYASLTGG